jgi:hypothetical protein
MFQRPSGGVEKAKFVPAKKGGNFLRKVVTTKRKISPEMRLRAEERASWCSNSTADVQ